MLNKPKTLLLLGFILVFLGFILPFLMVMQILESTFFLNFFSYAVSISGLFIGMLGAVLLYQTRR